MELELDFLCFVFNPFGSKNFDAVSCLKYLLEAGAVSNLTYLNPSLWASLAAQWCQNLPASAGDAGSIPGSGRSSGGEGMATHSSILGWGQRSLEGLQSMGS